MHAPFSHRFRFLGLLLATSAVLVACGDSTAPTGASPPPPPPPPPQVSYLVRDLDPLPGLANRRSAEAVAINDLGQIVGNSRDTDGQRHAVLWTVDEAGRVTGPRDLGTFDTGTSSTAMGINNLGQVVGFADNAGFRRPFIWTEDGGMQDLGVPDGLLGGQAHAINDQGQIVGSFITESRVDLTENGRVAIWTVGTDGAVTEIQDLGTFGGQAATAWANNELGHVAGAIWFGRGPEGTLSQTGFFWSEEEGAVPIERSSQGLSINDKDEVVGPGTVRGESFLWSEERGYTVIDADFALGINNSTQAVGRASEEGAFLWEDGELHLLPLSLGRTAGTAWAVNEIGIIVGTSFSDAGNSLAHLWTPN